ncbi:MAG: MerR family transcriptional regulator [Candidatus Sericytochromatia bacterium]|nr:MerR family transcriptional regulator [Candidatus Tanganyikabacteria bacterium]
MNISAAADAIGVTPDKIRKWDERIPSLQIPRDPAGRRRFDDQSLQLLAMVKELQEQGRSFDTITAVLDRPSADVLTGAPVRLSPEAAQRLWLEETLKAARDAAASREAMLAGALDEAMRERDNLERDLQNLRERVADLARRNDELAGRLAATSERLERAELITAVRQEPAKPWWKLW